MYPAIEIDLHLPHVCAAQRSSPAALEPAFRDLHLGHQPAPLEATAAYWTFSMRPPVIVAVASRPSVRTAQSRPVNAQPVTSADAWA